MTIFWLTVYFWIERSCIAGDFARVVVLVLWTVLICFCIKTCFAENTASLIFVSEHLSAGAVQFRSRQLLSVGIGN